jgi:hypothetical protein
MLGANAANVSAVRRPTGHLGCYGRYQHQHGAREWRTPSMSTSLQLPERMIRGHGRQVYLLVSWTHRVCVGL